MLIYTRYLVLMSTYYAFALLSNLKWAIWYGTAQYLNKYVFHKVSPEQQQQQQQQEQQEQQEQLTNS